MVWCGVVVVRAAASEVVMRGCHERAWVCGGVGVVVVRAAASEVVMSGRGRVVWWSHAYISSQAFVLCGCHERPL